MAVLCGGAAARARAAAPLSLPGQPLMGAAWYPEQWPEQRWEVDLSLMQAAGLNGQEQYHGAIVGPDGTPLPIDPEIRRTADEFHRAAPALAGTAPRSQVALILTCDSRWAIDFQPHTVRYNELQVLLDFYRPLLAAAQSVDIVEATAPLDGYRLVIAPALNVLPQELADHLLAYVRQGGHLLLGPRSGMKNEEDGLSPERQPGPLAVPSVGGWSSSMRLTARFRCRGRSERAMPIYGPSSSRSAMLRPRRCCTMAPVMDGWMGSLR